MTYHGEFERTLPCGCNNGHLCDRAKAIWDALLRWMYLPSRPEFSILHAEWDEHFNPVPCSHVNQVVQTNGSRRFVSGEVDDDMKDDLVCIDCGQVVEHEPSPCLQNSTVF